MQGIFQKENTDKALKYGIYRHLPTYEKIIRNLVSFYYKEPIKWKNVINSSNEGDLFKIISYVFILDTTFSEENNKGIMLISEDENVFNKSNMYEYYYNKSLIPLIKGLFESNYSNE